MKRTFILSLAFAGTLCAESICGKKFFNPTPDIERVEVACINWALIAKVAQGFPMPPGAPNAQTQLLVYPKFGRAVEGTAATTEYQVQQVRKAPDGSPQTMLVFDGMDHQTLPKLEVLIAPSDKN